MSTDATVAARDRARVAALATRWLEPRRPTVQARFHASREREAETRATLAAEQACIVEALARRWIVSRLRAQPTAAPGRPR